MSGAVEAVGLALAIFPLVISLLEHYEDGYNTLGDWVFFRREYTNLVNNLSSVQIIFRLHIEAMLRSITDSEFELNEMMDDVNSRRWEDKELTSKLKAKLSGEGEYMNYNTSIRAIHENLVNMQARLDRCGPPTDPSTGSPQKGLQLQKRFRKLQFVLRKNKWKEQVESLSGQIDRIGKLFNEAEALAPARQSKSSATAKIVGHTRSQASSLYRAISESWRDCDCPTPHAFQLVMIRRSHKLLAQATDARVLKISFPRTARPPSTEDTVPGNHEAWCSFNTMMFDPGREHEASIAPPSRSEQRSATTSLGRKSSKTDTTRSASTFTRQPSIWSQETSSTGIESASYFPGPNAPNIIEDLCQALQGHGKAECLGYLHDGQGAYHVFNTNPTLTFTSAEVDRIVSLDSILNTMPTHTKSARRSDKEGVMNLDLSRAQRMSVALTLAYAMLELYPTPWLPQVFGKVDVYFFVRKNGEVITENPFLLCRDLHARKLAVEKIAATSHDHVNALLALGIMIMEMWFGQSIESRPFWREHCDEKGNEGKFTSFTAAIEWQKKAKDEAGIPLHEITYRCVRGIVGPTHINLDDSECVRAILDQVIKPLEGILRHFGHA